MISRYSKSLFAAMALIVVLVGGPAGAAQPGGDPAVIQVAHQYFAALQAGDRHALLALFAGQAHERTKAQLDDPDYSQFLVDRYRNASLEVTGSGEQNGMSFVDVAIKLNATEYVRERLFLKSSGVPGSAMHIVARKELTE